MENNKQQRTIFERLWNPTNPEDENLIRIFFWVSIIICVILPRIFEGLLQSKAGQTIIIGWVVFAIFIRFRGYAKR
ncbi:MAG: hypothetical protein FP816_01755 [Desulfobacteraceae bacterium]|nr:hypothetical protein [Desulfobacteraceae bacterium]MBU4001504.1 hypothetical protein [Pseudomonadota bacterium]MBU4054994.1 hypothetical protein [Pseudomonadota bacterium]